MYEINEFDIWTPQEERDRHLARIVLRIAYYSDGEWVQYMIGGSDGYSDRCCRGETFRGWISKMKAIRTVDEELKILIESND